MLFAAFKSTPSTTADPVSTLINPECDIKGNVSHGTDRKIYHVPGSEDYEGTVVDPTRGERWFCSEAEAQANGWTKGPPQE